MEKAASLRIVKSCEDRSAVKHCAQVRLTFKIIDRQMKGENEMQNEWVNIEQKEDIEND